MFYFKPWWPSWLVSTFVKLYTPMMVVAKFGLFGPVVLEEKIFVKVNDDGRR